MDKMTKAQASEILTSPRFNPSSLDERLARTVLALYDDLELMKAKHAADLLAATTAAVTGEREGCAELGRQLAKQRFLEAKAVLDVEPFERIAELERENLRFVRAIEQRGKVGV